MQRYINAIDLRNLATKFGPMKNAFIVAGLHADLQDPGCQLQAILMQIAPLAIN
jgi:hypothetical protein